MRTALKDERVKGAILVDGYAYDTPGQKLRFYLGRALHPASWWNVISFRHPAMKRMHSRSTNTPDSTSSGESNPEAVAMDAERRGFYLLPTQDEAEKRLHALAQRDCELCFVYTPTRIFGRASQFPAMFPALANHARVNVVFIPFANHLFTLLASQEVLASTVENWMSKFVQSQLDVAN